jgi:hypothetical protein
VLWLRRGDGTKEDEDDMSTKTPATIASDAESTEFAVAGRDIVESLKEASAAGYLAEARLVLADRAALVERAEKVTADRDRLAAELAAVRGSGGVLTREECAAMLRRAYHASEVDGAYVDAAVRGARAQRARDVAVVRAVVERLKRERDAVALERAQWTPSERPLSGVDADLDCADAALDAATDCLAALTSDADAEPVAAAAPSGTVRGTIDGAEVTITAGPGVDPAELRDVCLRAVEAWVNGKATPPPLALTAEDREALGRAAREAHFTDLTVDWKALSAMSREPWIKTGVAIFTLGADAMASAAQSEEAARGAYDVAQTDLTETTRRRLAAAVAVARRSLRVEAKIAPGERYEHTACDDAVKATRALYRTTLAERDAARRDLAQCQAKLAAFLDYPADGPMWTDIGPRGRADWVRVVDAVLRARGGR